MAEKKVFGVLLTDEQEKKLKIFKDILKKYNGEFNLTSIDDDEGIDCRHFYDSLTGVEMFTKNSTVVEIGSGGGFPSVPLKIAREDLSFTLIEATGKKCRYLETVVKELELKKVTVVNGRAEEFGKKKEYREKFDHAVARAVAPLNVLCEYCLPFVKKGGSFVAYKGNAEEEISSAENAVKVLGGNFGRIEKRILPDGSGRTLVEILKTDITPSVYPRGNGKERKKPL